MKKEEPCAPATAFRWFVMFGTCWTEVVAANKDDAVILGMDRARTTRRQDVTVRRLRPSDDERQSQWKATAQQLGLTDRKAGLAVSQHKPKGNP